MHITDSWDGNWLSNTKVLSSNIIFKWAFIIFTLRVSYEDSK